MAVTVDNGHEAPKILMDIREPDEVRSWLEAEGIEVEVKRLDVGDFQITSDLIVERKRGTDLASSIRDRRLFEQIIRAHEAQLEPIVILEEFDTAFSTGMNDASIFGALVFLAWRFKTPVIPSRDWKDTALILKRLAIRCHVKDEDPLLARAAPKLLSIDERKAYILEGMFNVGPKTATKLIEEFGTPMGVFKALEETSVIYTKSGNPKGIDGPLKRVKGIGHSFVTANKVLLQ